MTQIGPITHNLINSISKELKKESTKEKISTQIIDPIISEVHSKLKLLYYGIISFVLTIIILLLFIAWKVFNIDKMMKVSP